jgi:DNA-binding NarL/FixJ family response regulator
MTGAELAEAFTRACPRARVLFMSGYAEDAIASRGTPPSADDYLPKPLTPDALTRKVREVLSR